MKTELLLLTSEGALHAAVPPGEYVIGSGEEADIRIDDPTVSGCHARLVVEGETVALQDLDSDKGTFVEGEAAVGPTNIYDGQTAVLGSVALRVRQSVDTDQLAGASRYVRGGMVAHGGMGAIHEARQAAMGRKVAMKVMLHSWNSSSVKRFLDEARITGMLEHPNIVPVHELGIDEEDQFFYTMKFVRGVTLAEVIAGLSTGNPESVEKFPLAILLTIFQKVCDGVAFAHSRGVWHRDLKPENIMIGDFGEVLVMDWGLAKEAGFAPLAAPAEDSSSGDHEDPASLRTVDGAVLGTPAYMSPEQARGDTSAVDQRSDVYALGGILHEILYLRPAVRGESRGEVLEKAAAGMRELPESRIAPHLPARRVPASLEAVCRKAMALDPQLRYQQVQDLQADITAYQSGFATTAEHAGAAKQFALFVKRNRRVSVAVASGLLALALVTGWFTVHLLRARWEAERQALLADEKRREAEQQTQLAQEQRRRAEEQRRIASENFRRATSAEESRKAAETERDSAVKELVAKSGDISEAAMQLLSEAESFILQERAEEALQRLDSAVELAPQEPRLLARRGDLYQTLWRFEDSAKDYQAALARGPDRRISRNLELSREMSAGGDSAALRRKLEVELMNQDRQGEIPLMYQAATKQKIASGETSPRDVLLSRLKPYKLQGRWRNDDRVESLPDGTLRLDLSGLEITDLSALRGLAVSELNLADTNLRDLAALRGLKLRSLDLTRVPVSDLEPLGPMPLQFLQLFGTGVETLEPLRDMPLSELHADAPKLRDFSALESLRSLELLTLPSQAARLDLSALQSLKTVFQDRFQPSVGLPAEKFRRLSAQSDEAWDLWGNKLTGLPYLAKIGPERLTVRVDNGGIDLDLRGTGIRDLQPVAGLPLRRLEIDTADAVVDLSPLAGHKTLCEIDLMGANVASVAPLLKCPRLEAVAMDRDVSDIALLGQVRGLRRAGYSREPDGLLPRSTAEEFFAARSRLEAKSERDAMPESAAYFDNARDNYSGWTVKLRDGKLPPLGRMSWVPDPAKDGGRGGGYLAYRERSDDAREAYFSVPKEMFARLGDLYGYTLEFDLRLASASDKKSKPGADLIISNGKQAIVRSWIGGPPRGRWLRFVQGLHELSWAEVGVEDRPAREEVVRAVLAKPQEILIRAEFDVDGSDYGAEIDEVEFWNPRFMRRPMSIHGG